MERNVELLEKTMQHIKDHPEMHDQSLWVNSCGTTACFAGWALMFNGLTAKEVSAREAADSVQGDAADALGLTTQESDVLFHSLNTRENLERMVKALVNGEDIRHLATVSRNVRAFTSDYIEIEL